TRTGCTRHERKAWRSPDAAGGGVEGVITTSTECPRGARYVDFAGPLPGTDRTLYIAGKGIGPAQMESLLSGMRRGRKG
ncbi:MAG: hypothetical protein ACRCY9_04850, partial [Phycicoccus sp.]